jgi:hypothetical protein
LRRLLPQHMRIFLSLLVIAVLIAACFLPWMTVEARDITISGIDTTGTTFGKPAYFHFFWVGLYLLFLLLNKIWSRRVAMGVAAFNFAWAVRNFLIIPACQMGECPVRKVGLYLLLLSSFVLLFAGLVGPVKQRAVDNGQ